MITPEIQLLKVILENRINSMIITKYDLKDILNDSNLMNKNIKIIEEIDDDVEEYFKDLNLTIIVKDIENMMLNKYLVIVKNNPNIHFILWKPYDNTVNTKMLEELSYILKCNIYINSWTNRNNGIINTTSIDDLNNVIKLNEGEKFQLSLTRSNDKFYNADLYPSIEDIYFQKLKGNIDRNNYTLTLSDCCTNLINELFDKKIDNDTFVITSRQEHPSTRSCFEKIPQFKKKELEICPDTYEDFIRYGRTYKKLFIYMLCTSITTGKLINFDYVKELVSLLKENNIEYTFILDNCQGMFLLPIDYSIYDYILGTAHAYAINYDMGICFSKNGDIGEKVNNWAKDYIPKLNIFLERISVMHIIKDKVIQFFKDNLGDCFTVYDSVDHIISIRFNKPLVLSEEENNKLFKAKLRIEDDNNVLRIRTARLIESIEQVVAGLPTLIDVVKNSGL